MIKFTSLLFYISCCLFEICFFAQPVYAQQKSSWWDVQSIDTMKYSRDVSREKMKDASFDTVIDTQIKNIAASGATHVAISTPYDEEFVPMLSRWVGTARRYGLNVWFRGNMSGWEQWFEYPKMTREQHVVQIKKFITSHAELFNDNDIFTPCPECENGGPGDPRHTGDIDGHRRFLIADFNSATDGFRQIGKGVRVGYYSMNFDVAKIIMDKQTTEALGGVVVIDHYIKSATQMKIDVEEMVRISGGKIFLGEFGAPIPDIHGKMSDSEQATWIDQALTDLATAPSLIGVNYWVNVGGSTELWDDKGNARKAVATIESFYRPKIVEGIVMDQYKRPIANVDVSSQYKSVKTDINGKFSLPILKSDVSLTAKYKQYTVGEITNGAQSDVMKIVLPISSKPWWLEILDFFKYFFK